MIIYPGGIGFPLEPFLATAEMAKRAIEDAVSNPGTNLVCSSPTAAVLI